jgi:polyisoprenoid-binding protein YceI
MRRPIARLALAFPAALAVAACTTADAAERSSTVARATAGDVAATAQPAVALRLVVAPAGNEARYRVQERLMGRDLDNDAVGVTGAVTGGIALDSAGRVIPGASRFTVDVSGLKTDNDRRDNYVRRRLLQTDSFPTVELRPTAVQGLPANTSLARPPAGPQTLTLVGDLTVRGVTRPTTWQVTAEYKDGRVVGKAATRFTFAEFQMSQPRVPIVLSVSDTIRLEYDFTLVAERAGM